MTETMTVAEGAASGEVAPAAESLLQQQARVEGGEAPVAAPAEPAARELPPLPPAEVERRWRQSQAALREARSEAREAIAALQAEVAELRGRQAEGEPDGCPDPETDPVGALRWLASERAGEQAARRTEAERSAQAEAEAQAMAARAAYVTGAITEDEAGFVETAPDYYEAVAFLRESRREELLGLGADPRTVDQMVAADFLQGVQDALAQGLSPARLAYSLAGQRGYVRGRGGDALERIAAGQTAARTLTAIGARAEAPGASIEERLNGLSGSALRAAWARIKAEARN